MYDRFDAQRTDDVGVSAKPPHNGLTQQSNTIVISSSTDIHTSDHLISTNISLKEIEETDRSLRATRATTTTTPPSQSPCESLSGAAYAFERGGQPNITTTNINNITTKISGNIRTVVELAEVASQPHRNTSSNNNHNHNHQKQQADTTTGDCELETPATSAYQLRALTGNRIEQEGEGEGELRRNLNQRPDVNSLSLRLIEETLNYFISCKHRLSQITRTFDDSNALIMLLQEKEEDLEVVGQLGQDLLRRYNELREAYEGQRQELAKFQEELAKCREDNQQLKYDLASNKSLLDTFKEEEEQQLEQQNISINSRVCAQCQADEEGQLFSLRSQADRSLTYLENELYKQMCELKDELLEVRERELSHKLLEQERNLQLEAQLRDNERRQTDLESENENLRDQQRELQQVIETQSRRFDELLGIFSEYQREARAHYLNTGNYTNNNISFNYLTESSPSYDSQLNSLLLLDQPHHNKLDTQQLHSQQSHQLPTGPAHHHQYEQQHQQPQQQQNQQIVRPIVRKSSSSNLVTSTSLHEELLESMQKNREFHESEDEDDESDDDENHLNGHQHHHRSSDEDGPDSGLHTRNISTSTTPVDSAGPSGLDTDDDGAVVTSSSPPDAAKAVSQITNSSESTTTNLSQKLNCLGLTTFTLTTLLLLCLSATFNSTTNSNLAQKLQHINLNQ